MSAGEHAGIEKPGDQGNGKVFKVDESVECQPPQQPIKHTLAKVAELQPLQRIVSVRKSIDQKKENKGQIEGMQRGKKDIIRAKGLGVREGVFPGPKPKQLLHRDTFVK